MVSPLLHVPRLCDELDLAHHRILLDEMKEGGKAIHFMELPCQGRRKIEAEPVYVPLGDPGPEAVHEELEGVGMPHV